MENTNPTTTENKTDTIFLPDCIWNKNPKVRTESTEFQVSGSIGFGSGMYQEKFNDLLAAIDFATTKLKLPNPTYNEYWNNQRSIITKVTVTTEIVRVVTPEEKK